MFPALCDSTHPGISIIGTPICVVTGGACGIDTVGDINQSGIGGISNERILISGISILKKEAHHPLL